MAKKTKDENLTYPVVITGEKDEELNRFLPLVKWLLLIPHYIVLSFLWIAFLVLTVIAFFAILIKGRYPRGIFDFNVGVLRWTWRVGFYGYKGLGTDKYPPFSLKARDYPATLQVEYPERLSRGLVLVKWWLLAIPHYLILTVLTSGLPMFRLGLNGSLLALLVLIVLVLLLVKKRYPEDIFQLILGINRWAFRVIGYTGLMTDEYPPFRLSE